MSRHSSITQTWIGIESGNRKPALGIRKLVRVQLQIVQCLDIIAARGTQKPSPERAQMIPPRAQMLMVMVRNEPQVAQAELCNDSGNLLRHCKQSGGEAGVLPGGAPGDDECISHQLNCHLTREQASRARWPTLPRVVALRSLPPCLVSEMNIGEEKRTSARPPACGRIQSHPQITVYPHHLRQRARVAFSDHLRRLQDEPLVEFVNKLETGAARPGRWHE